MIKLSEIAKLAVLEGELAEHEADALADHMVTAHHNKIKDGYLSVYTGKNHPVADPMGYAPIHRLVWAAAGRELPPKSSILHHINGNKDDNRLDNFEAMARAVHNHHHLQEDIARDAATGRLKKVAVEFRTGKQLFKDNTIKSIKNYVKQSIVPPKDLQSSAKSIFRHPFAGSLAVLSHPWMLGAAVGGLAKSQAIPALAGALGGAGSWGAGIPIGMAAGTAAQALASQAEKSIKRNQYARLRRLVDAKHNPNYPLRGTNQLLFGEKNAATK